MYKTNEKIFDANEKNTIEMKVTLYNTNGKS